MRLYHGTPLTAAEKIEAKGQISHDIERPYYDDTSMPTTNGFVYLTDNLGYAVYLAQRIAVVNSNDDLCVVYAVEINESELQADIDQLKYIGEMANSQARDLTALDSLDKVQSCQIARSLIIGKDVKEKLVFPSGSNNTHPDYELMKKLRQLRHIGEGVEAESLVQSDKWISMR